MNKFIFTQVDLYEHTFTTDVVEGESLIDCIVNHEQNKGQYEFSEEEKQEFVDLLKSGMLRTNPTGGWILSGEEVATLITIKD